MNDSITSEGKEPEAPQSDLVRVLFLRVHRDYGYFAGDIGMISSTAAEKLSQCKTKIQNGIVVTEEPYIEILPEGWIEPAIEKVTGPELVFVKVRWLLPHPDYGYFAGDIGMISSTAAEKLSQCNSKIQNGIDVTREPYITILPEGWTEPAKGVFTRIKDYLKTKK